MYSNILSDDSCTSTSSSPTDFAMFQRRFLYAETQGYAPCTSPAEGCVSVEEVKEGGSHEAFGVEVLFLCPFKKGFGLGGTALVFQLTCEYSYAGA